MDCARFKVGCKREGKKLRVTHRSYHSPFPYPPQKPKGLVSVRETTPKFTLPVPHKLPPTTQRFGLSSQVSNSFFPPPPLLLSTTNIAPSLSLVEGSILNQLNIHYLACIASRLDPRKASAINCYLVLLLHPFVSISTQFLIPISNSSSCRQHFPFFLFPPTQPIASSSPPLAFCFSTSIPQGSLPFARQTSPPPATCSSTHIVYPTPSPRDIVLILSRPVSCQVSRAMTTFPPTPDASPKVKNSSLLNSAPSPASSTSSVTLADEPSACVSAEDDNSSSPLAASTSSRAHGNSSPTTPQSIAKSPKCTESETVPCIPPPPSSPAHIGNFQRVSPSTHHHSTVGFDSLPPTVLVEIFGHALRGDCGEISPNLIEYTDPRFLNHNFCALLERRRSLSRLSRLSRFARAYLQPHLYSPAVVTSMTELNSLSGYYYPEVDWKKKGKQPVLETDGNGTPVKPRLPAKRRKAFKGRGRKIKELVVIIAGLPGDMLDDNPSVRWPGWYIEDWMRYDLEALAVERLTILAPSQGKPPPPHHQTSNREVSRVKPEKKKTNYSYGSYRCHHLMRHHPKLSNNKAPSHRGEYR